MLKSARIFLLIALCSTSALSQEKTSLQIAHFFGPVHTIHSEQTLLRAGETGPHKRAIADLTFDLHGNTTESTSYGEDGKVKQKLSWERSYDGQGRVTEIRYRDGTGQLTNTGRYTYRERERTVDLVQINPGGSVNHNAILVYDEAGNLVRDTRHFPTHPTFDQTMDYDSKGHLTEHRSYKVDDKGNFELTEHSTWKVDAYGNTIEWVLETPGNTLQMTKRTIECDEKGNVVRAVNLNRDGSVGSTETIAYVFDDRRNWTRKTMTREVAGQVVLFEITERTFTYY